MSVFFTRCAVALSVCHPRFGASPPPAVDNVDVVEAFRLRSCRLREASDFIEVCDGLR